MPLAQSCTDRHSRFNGSRDTLQKGPHEFTPMRKPAPPSNTASLWIERIQRNAVPIVLAIFALVWGWRTMSPKQLFVTDQERAQFLTAAGVSPSIRIITLGAEWCPACKQLENKLTTDNIPHLALDLEKNPAARDLFRRAQEVTGSNSIPKIILDKDVVSPAKLFVELARGDVER